MFIVLVLTRKLLQHQLLGQRLQLSFDDFELAGRKLALVIKEGLHHTVSAHSGASVLPHRLEAN